MTIEDKTPERTHSTDTDFLTDLLGGIDVHLVELYIGELVGELLEDRADDLAGSTPGCPKVENGDLVLANLW